MNRSNRARLEALLSDRARGLLNAPERLAKGCKGLAGLMKRQARTHRQTAASHRLDGIPSKASGRMARELELASIALDVAAEVIEAQAAEIRRLKG